MNALIVVLAAHIALADAEQLTGKHRKIGTSKPHRFTQAALKGGDNDEKGVMSLLFHGPVTPRHINFGLEDSNRGVVNEIELSEGGPTRPRHLAIAPAQLDRPSHSAVPALKLGRQNGRGTRRLRQRNRRGQGAAEAERGGGQKLPQEAGRSTATVFGNRVQKRKKRSTQGQQTEQQTHGSQLRERLRQHFSDFEARQQDAEDVDVEYVAPSEAVGDFQGVFERFAQLERISLDLEPEPEKPEQDGDDDFDSDEEEEDESRRTMSSKKKLKLMNRPTLAQLKQVAEKPELVEFWDTTAANPRFLVWLKAQRNTIPVPSHWSEKMRYMQTRRSYDKPAYKLPPYIEDTKIAEIRSAIKEREANKSLKQKMREKVRPKSHRMDINYQILHDAFFKYATKPAMTRYGDLYYEGKEMELRMRHYRPGRMSERLRKALGVGDNAPPPWLINMQRFGPPPSYPNLKIPGVNAPLPEGASFGFHAGGWGQLPTDDSGNPLFGYIDSNYYEDHHISKALWGELPEDDSDAADRDDDSDSDASGEELPEEGTEVQAPSVEVPIPVVNAGLDTPADLRPAADPPRAAPRKAYTVLEPKAAQRSASALFGSQVTYSMPPVATPIVGCPPPLLTALQTPVTGQAGAATPLGGLVTPSLNLDGAMSTENVMRQLKFHETKAKLVQEAAGQVAPEPAEPKRAKKKREFKF
ncbi:PSP protein [Babesia caballi]|uniref:PSP protein n=1 Tax=Babesia caballi TaxID=5871 RepID=A0AAV4LYP1_BABCB|nr:PSP protein [Babesia caballi]